jgi:hypothetical protein
MQFYAIKSAKWLLEIMKFILLQYKFLDLNECLIVKRTHFKARKHL